MTDIGAILRRSRRLLEERRKAIDEERIDLTRMIRLIGEELDELTPVRPASRTDVAAAFATAGAHSEAAAEALKKT